MKKVLLIAAILLSFLQITFAATPTLSANTTQACYDGTTKPILNIVSGSAKTSYVSGAINDPTNAAFAKGIYFTSTNLPTSFTITSDNTSVVPVANVTVTLISGDQYVCKIKPITVGYATIKIIATNGANSPAYTIEYGASAASAYVSNTIFPTGIADASAAAAVDDNFMFVADDETNLLRLFSRKESGQSLYSLDITTLAGGTSGEEFDLEGASKSSATYNSGNRIYWIASLGNSKSGNLKPYRDRVIATDISGTGAATTLTVKGYSTKMRTALISWGNANTWNFTASAADGMIAKRIDGFNIEGLTVCNEGEKAFIGFRAPCVPLKGTTPTSGNRVYAVIAPITNFETMMNISGNSGVTPTIGEPILFDFGGLGIRSIERVGGNKYLILAGLFEGGGTPKVYLWDGVIPASPGTNPITTASSSLLLLPLNLTDLVQPSADGGVEGHPEALLGDQIGNNILTHLICDNGTVDYYADATEAKLLPNVENMKYRMDTYVYSLTGDPALLLTSGTNTQSINAGGAISSIIYTWGGAATGVTVTGLPTGVSAISNAPGKNVSITGTPSVTGTFTYTVTTTQASGTAAVLTGTIDIIPLTPPTLVLTSGTASQSVVQGTAISSIVYTYGGGATDVNVTGLPSGFIATKNGAAKTVTLSGSSVSVLSATSYTLTTVGSGPAVILTGTITVTADPNAAAMGNSGGSLSQTVVPAASITPIVLTWAGGSTGITITGLPAGLTATTDGGAKTVTISGTPTATGTYSATTVGGTLSPVTLTGTITVGSSSTILADWYPFQEATISLSFVTYSSGTVAPAQSATAPCTVGSLNLSSSAKMILTLQSLDELKIRIKNSGARTLTLTYGPTGTENTWGPTSYAAGSRELDLTTLIPTLSSSSPLIVNVTNGSGGSLEIHDLYVSIFGTPTSYQKVKENRGVKLIQTANELTIYGAELSKIHICDITGKMLLYNNASQSINISSLNKGIYVVLIETRNGTTLAEKFIKQ
jgi:hypothetical protein